MITYDIHRRGGGPELSNIANVIYVQPHILSFLKWKLQKLRGYKLKPENKPNFLDRNFKIYKMTLDFLYIRLVTPHLMQENIIILLC